MAQPDADGKEIWAVLLGLIAWSAWFVARSTFEVNGELYFSLFDDAMISMVYARNFVEGFGLNWARWGDPVEGFTCPLWTALMIPVNALPLPLRLRSGVVQLLSLVVLCANLFVVRRLVLEHFSDARARSALPALVLTAAYFPLNHWSLMGMETALQAFWALLAVHLTLQIVHGGSQRGSALLCVLTAAVLTRMDMALLAVACLGYVAASRRGLPLRRWLPGAAFALLLLGGYQVFRTLYFGDPLPNTYYLKMTGTPAHVRFARGLVMFLDFARPILLPLLAVAAGAWFLRGSRPQVRLLLAVIALDFLYVIYIGGDVYDLFGSAGRFIGPVMPLVFVLANGVWNDALARLPERWRNPRALRYATAGFAVSGVLASNGLLDVQEKGQWKTFLVIQRPLFADKNPQLVERTRRLQQLLEPDALVAVSWAGVPPYFSDFRLADFLGYNDRRIARMAPVARLRLDDHARFDPGHLKWDIAYIVDEVRPVAIYLNGSMKAPLASGAPGYTLVEELFWLRNDSGKLRAPPTASAPER